jgi:hypothetical protein
MHSSNGAKSSGSFRCFKIRAFSNRVWIESWTDPRHVMQKFLSKQHLKRALAKDIVEVFYEKVSSKQNTGNVFDSMSRSLQVSLDLCHHS